MYKDLRIDFADKKSLANWSAELKCSEEDLIHAVLRIGNRAKSVNDFLILNRKKNESVKTSHFTYFCEDQIQKVWERASVIENMDSKIYRLDNCGAMIKNGLYLKGFSALSMGWEIDLIKPISQGGTYELRNLQALQWENKKAKADFFPFWKCKVSEDYKENYYL